MVLDPAHAAGMPLVLPLAQRGSAVIPRSVCRFHHRSCSDATLISYSCDSWRALAHPYAFHFVDAVSFPDPFAAQVLTTFCDAINQHDLNMAWGQYAKALQNQRV